MTTLIVAEDDENVRAMVRLALTGAGYRVIEAVDGQDAWEKMRVKRPDGLVLDVNMPRMDGLALCRKVRAAPAFSKTPVLMLTIRDLVEDRVRGLDCGADEYLSKPFEPAVLVSVATDGAGEGPRLGGGPHGL